MLCLEKKYETLWLKQTVFAVISSIFPPGKLMCSITSIILTKTSYSFSTSFFYFHFPISQF